MATPEADCFDLQRFVKAQKPVYDQVLEELGKGRKTTHWMWFVFPQILGLGQSVMSMRYAISGLVEAHAYLMHEVLGPRLAECTGLVLAHANVATLFGSPDEMKFKSSMTLFEAAGGPPVFATALNTFFGGERDAATIDRL